MLVVAGAGMAGLCAAARARELGLDVVVHEKGDRAGGSMLLSSCVVFRHRTLDGFREDCPDGDPALQRIVVEELDDALVWLESLGAPVLAKETGNPRTVGRRFDPVGLTEALVRAAGDVRLASPFPAGARPLLLATGNARIVEDCTKRASDSGRVWGATGKDGRWDGRNKLGTRWMELRATLREPVGSRT